MTDVFSSVSEVTKNSVNLVNLKNPGTSVYYSFLDKINSWYLRTKRTQNIGQHIVSRKELKFKKIYNNYWY